MEKVMYNKLEFFDDYIIKTYLDTEVNTMSSLDNEIFCINKFGLKGKNIYCPKVERLDKNSLKIKRYKFALGNLDGINESNIKRILFTISFREFVRQTQEIENFLKKTEINHRDINPGNLLFSEEDRHLKVIDFYWSKTDDLIVGNPPALNKGWFYNDSLSFQKIRKLVEEVFESIKKPIEDMSFFLSEMGKIYRDGSAGEAGRAYHRIDIPYFYSVPISKDVTKEFTDILANISCKPKKILDVGCAVGYNSFNIIRKFFLEKLITYEADPYVFSFLQECKKVFNLNELELNEKIDYDTTIPKVDVVLCTNTHMWIYKQLGKEKTDVVMRNLISNCKELFFQTAGAESEGMFCIKELKNKEDIQKYLYSVGSKEVSFISSTTAHGGLRHLFKVRGNQRC